MRTGTAYQRILDHLSNAGVPVRETSPGQASARCPAHDDHNPSLSITGIEGQTLIHCHAGCHLDDILTAIHLKPADLYDDTDGVRYDYRDTTGRLLRTVHRSPDKKFRQDINDQAPGTPLYRLTEVVAAVASGVPVHLVEGEKDVHALEAAGAVATSGPMGATSFGRVDVRPLTGATVTAVVDRDDAGQKWARLVADKVGPIAATLTFAHAATGKDAADHIAAGFTVQELVPVQPPAPHRDERDDDTGARRLHLTAASTIVPRPVHWLWQHRLPRGTFNLLGGAPDLGKSTIAYDIAAHVTQGTLPGELEHQPRAVIVVATEDSWEHTIVPRLMAAGADLTRVYRVDVVVDESIHATLSLPEDNIELERAIRDRDVALVLLDPLMSRLSSRLDSHKDADVRRGLEPLSRIADRTGVVVLGLIHMNKSAGGSALSRFMGSTAFPAVARVSYLVVADPDDDTGARRLLIQAKNNIAAKVPPRAYRIDPWEMTTEHGRLTAGQIVWLEDLAARTADDVLNQIDGKRNAAANGEPATVVDTAAAWLLEQLDDTGRAQRTDLVDLAKGDYTVKTLQRARDAAGVHVASLGFPKKSTWYLPDRWHVIQGSLVQRHHPGDPDQLPVDLP